MRTLGTRLLPVEVEPSGGSGDATSSLASAGEASTTGSIREVCARFSCCSDFWICSDCAAGAVPFFFDTIGQLTLRVCVRKNQKLGVMGLSSVKIVLIIKTNASFL